MKSISIPTMNNTPVIHLSIQQAKELFRWFKKPAGMYAQLRIVDLKGALVDVLIPHPKDKNERRLVDLLDVEVWK